MPLYHAVYHSRRLAQDDQYLDDILTSARRNNAALDVTGVLLVDDDYFIQILEGRRLILTQLIVKIAQDKRHTNLELALFGAAPQRMFSNWSMGGVALEEEQKRLFSDSSTTAADPSAMSGHVIWDLVLTVAGRAETGESIADPGQASFST